jgi:hypothetical protein
MHSGHFAIFCKLIILMEKIEREKIKVDEKGKAIT